jgi:hypothetical protein
VEFQIRGEQTKPLGHWTGVPQAFLIAVPSLIEMKSIDIQYFTGGATSFAPYKPCAVGHVEKS